VIADSEGDIMLSSFLEWASRYLQVPLRAGLRIEITEGQTTDNSGARLDIETNKYVARITFWESGAYVAEALDVETEATVFFLEGLCSEIKSLDQLFLPLFELIEVPPLSPGT
jgi:hypothetical protein